MKKSLLACAIFPLLASCATLVNGPSQSVCFTSTPSDALVFVDQTYQGKTPTAVKLERSSSHVVRMELDGYKPYEWVLNRTLSGWFFGNILIGGPIGLGVDALSGGMYKFKSSNIHADIQQLAIADLTAEDGVKIIVVEKADPSWEKVGQLQRAQ